MAKAQYSYSQGLPLADNPTAEEQNEMPIDILVGSDQYWAFIEESIIQGYLLGTIATFTKLGYVLSGPVHCQGNNQFSINFVSTHFLKTDAQPVEDDINLNNELSRFWELKHIGTQKQEPSVYA